MSTNDPSLCGLPQELVHIICGFLPVGNVSSLSLANHRLRHFTIPRLFRSIALDTNEPSSATFFIKAAARYGHFVRSLRIMVATASCQIASCRQCDGQGQDKEPPVWSYSSGKPALELLAGTYDAMLPSLNHIIVDFPSAYGRHEPTFSTEGQPVWVGNRNKEQTDAWAMIASQNLERIAPVFSALSRRGGKTTITRLTLKNPPMYDPRSIPARETSRWSAILESLEDDGLTVIMVSEGRI